MSELRLVNYYVDDPKVVEWGRLTGQGGSPWYTKSGGNAYQFMLKFADAKIKTIKYQNYNTPQLRVTFFYRSKQIDKRIFTFKDNEGKLWQQHNLNLKSFCDSVRLTFIRKQTDLQAQIGLKYFQMFDKKEVNINNSNYDNLSVQQIMSSKKKDMFSPSPNRTLNNNNLRNNILMGRTSSKNKNNSISSRLFQQPLSLKEIENKLSILCDRNDKGQLKQDQFRSEWDRLMQQKQLAEIKQAQKRSLKTKQRQKNILNKKPIEKKIVEQIVIDSDNQEGIQNYNLIPITNHTKMLFKILNSRAKQIQLKHQISLGIPQKYRFSNHINAVANILQERSFVLSGFHNEQREKLKKIGTSLGLSYKLDLSDGCLIVATNQSNPKIKDMKKFKDCESVNKQYLIDCQLHKAQMLIKDYPVPK